MKIADTLSPSVAGAAAVPVASLSGTARPSVQTLPAPAATPKPPPSAEATQRAARMINEFLKSSSAGIEFSVDDQTDRIIVRVIDAETRQLIRQIPSEEALAIAQSLDRLTGLLLAQNA